MWQYVHNTKFPNLHAQFLYSSTRFGLTRGHLQDNVHNTEHTARKMTQDDGDFISFNLF